MLSRLGILTVGAVLMVAPLASAEFGPESDEGWPINVAGDEIVPPVEPVYSPTRLMATDDAGDHVHASAADPLNKVGPFTLFPYYPVLTAEVQRLAMDHPDLVKLHSAGTSRAGLDMWLLEIADFDNPDMKPLDQREVVYLDGGTHSNEYSGVYFVTEVAQFLVDEYETNETAKWIVENRHTWILPMVNPDGSNAFGRMNAAWVNVNRNFPGSWGTVDEDMLFNNPGPEPASEPETRNVIHVLEQVQPDYVNSIHCCGNLWLHPYGAEQLGDAPDIEMYTTICDAVFADVRDDCGPIWSTIYPASGTTADEGYIRVGASSWTYEMSGRGAVMPWGQPAVQTDVREQEVESWRGVMHALLNVEKYGANPVVTELVGDASELVATVKNTGYGNLTEGTIAIDGVTVDLPFIAAGDVATVTVRGEFAPGDGEITLDYVERIHLQPRESRTLSTTLESVDGGLAAVLDATAAAASVSLNSADGGDGNPVPGAGLVFAAIAVVAVAAVVRRR